MIRLPPTRIEVKLEDIHEYEKIQERTSVTSLMRARGSRAEFSYDDEVAEKALWVMHSLIPLLIHIC